MYWRAFFLAFDGTMRFHDFRRPELSSAQMLTEAYNGWVAGWREAGFTVLRNENDDPALNIPFHNYAGAILMYDDNAAVD